jgi:hypothetical protein
MDTGGPRMGKDNLINFLQDKYFAVCKEIYIKINNKLYNFTLSKKDNNIIITPFVEK